MWLLNMQLFFDVQDSKDIIIDEGVKLDMESQYRLVSRSGIR